MPFHLIAIGVAAAAASGTAIACTGMNLAGTLDANAKALEGIKDTNATGLAGIQDTNQMVTDTTLDTNEVSAQISSNGADTAVQLAKIYKKPAEQTTPTDTTEEAAVESVVESTDQATAVTG
jgi:hypothetical protein